MKYGEISDRCMVKQQQKITNNRQNRHFIGLSDLCMVHLVQGYFFLEVTKIYILGTIIYSYIFLEFGHPHTKNIY